MLYCWEDNYRRSGVAQATRHRLRGLSTYELTASELWQTLLYLTLAMQ